MIVIINKDYTHRRPGIWWIYRDGWHRPFVLCKSLIVRIVVIRTRYLMIENNYLLPKLDQFASFDQAWPRTLKGRWEERRWVELNPPQIIAFFVVNLSRCVMISVWALSKSGLLQTRRVGGNVVTLCNYNTITPCLAGTQRLSAHYLITDTEIWQHTEIHIGPAGAACRVSR